MAGPRKTESAVAGRIALIEDFLDEIEFELMRPTVCFRDGRVAGGGDRPIGMMSDSLSQSDTVVETDSKENPLLRIELPELSTLASSSANASRDRIA